MTKQHTSKQPYVPRFLLKLFSYDRKHVYVLNREQNNKIYRVAADSICYENDLYDEKWNDAIEELGKYVLDNQVEDYLACLEEKTAPLIKNIISAIQSGTRQLVFNKEEKQLLIEFIVTLYLRNPYTLRNIIDFLDGVEYEPDCEAMMYVVNYLFTVTKWGSPVSLIKFSKKASLFNKDIEGSPCNIEYNNLNNMQYAFWFSKEGGFVTSSFPLHIISVDGTHAERIVFPISSQIAFVFFARLPFPLKEGMVIEINRDLVKSNMKTYFNAYESGMAAFFIAEKRDTLLELY